MRRWCCALGAALLLACAGDDKDIEARDVTDTGAAEDAIGRAGGDGNPPESLPVPADDSGAQTDTGFKRPERRPIRDVPPLTRPDTGRP